MKNTEYIINLIENGFESEYLDFKARHYTKDKHVDLIKDIMAMANSSHEGNKFIIVGLKVTSDKREAMGLIPDQNIDSSNYKQLILNNIEPEINFSYYNVDYQDKVFGVFELFDNDNRPYIVKKKYFSLNEGLCMIRKGSQQSFAKRKDYDEMYSTREKHPVFKVPSGSQRILAVSNDNMQSVLRDGIIMRNVGKTIAFNVSIHIFLDIYLLIQENFTAGDIPPNGKISLALLDNVVLAWRQAIAEIKGDQYARCISHTCSMLVEYEDSKGIKYMQPIKAAVSWGYMPNQYDIQIGSVDSYVEAKKVSSECEYCNKIELLINEWKYYINSRMLKKLESVDESVRELAWRLYKSGNAGASRFVGKIFSVCDRAKKLGRGLHALSEIEKQGFKALKKDSDNIKSLGKMLIYGINPAARPPFQDESLEIEFEEMLDQLKKIVRKDDTWFYDDH